MATPETVTIFKDTYQTLIDREHKQMLELATIKGRISALADMEDNPRFVFDLLKTMKKDWR